VVTPSIDKYFRLRGAVLAPIDGNGTESACGGRGAESYPLSAREGANGAWRDIDVRAHQLRAHRYLFTCFHNEEHGGSQCRYRIPAHG
jgi:hypothetical protein